MTDFNSGKYPQPGGMAVITTPQGVADVAVAGDISEIQDEAREEAAEAKPAPKKRAPRKTAATEDATDE